MMIAVPITPEDFALFMDWLRRQPKRGTYDYCDNRDCLIAKYLKAMGFTDVYVMTHRFSHSGYPATDGTDFPSGNLPRILDEISGYPKPRSGIRTFGGALRYAQFFV